MYSHTQMLQYLLKKPQTSHKIYSPFLPIEFTLFCLQDYVMVKLYILYGLKWLLVCQYHDPCKLETINFDFTYQHVCVDTWQVYIYYRLFFTVSAVLTLRHLNESLYYMQELLIQFLYVNRIWSKAPRSCVWHSFYKKNYFKIYPNMT